MNNDLNRNVFLMKISVIFSGLLLEIGGMIMIFFDFQAQGTIKIKSPIFEGQINATYIGLFVIFMGMILQCVAILRRYQFMNRKNNK